MVDVSFNAQRDALEDLLDEELTFEATTTDGLTNHLPMALVAKSGLGASIEELRRFATRYEVRLAPRGDAGTPLTSATWEGAIGKVGAFDALRDYFMIAVNDDGPEATVRRHLDALTSGICGAAFHGAIRLAYALELSSPFARRGRSRVPRRERDAARRPPTMALIQRNRGRGTCTTLVVTRLRPSTDETIDLR